MRVRNTKAAPRSARTTSDAMDKVEEPQQSFDLIHRAISLVRRGDFIGAATDSELMRGLAEVQFTNDFYSNHDWLTCQALLAEIYDQTGQYRRVGELFEDEDLVVYISRTLAKARTKYAGGDTVPLITDQQRRLIRAQSLYVLQAAIHHLRQFGPHLITALKLLKKTREILEAISSAQRKLYAKPNRATCRFHGVLSLFYYWQGRVLMAMGESAMAEAKDDLNASMRETERNLNFHYSGRPKIAPQDERMVYASYSLASAMIGIAQLGHISGDLVQASDLLRPVSALLRGTGDNYRRGYALMIMGAAERARSGARQDGLRKAISRLTTSLQLFAGPTVELTHGLHQARVHHQLALAHIYLAQARGSQTAARDEIKNANFHLKRARTLFGDFDKHNFGDPELEYDLCLTESRIRREERSYEEAHESAKAALDVAANYDFAPKFSKAKAYVAMGEAKLAQFEREPSNINLLTEAALRIANALETSGSNPAINTVALLYKARILMKHGEVHKARQVFRDALAKHGKEVQNGWVQQLAETLKKELKLPAPDFTIDLERIKEDIRRGHKQGLWDAAVRELEKSMIAWAEEVSPHRSYALLDLPSATFFRKKKELNTG